MAKKSLKLKLQVQSIGPDGTITLVPVVKHDHIHRCNKSGRKLTAKQIESRDKDSYTTERVLLENTSCFTEWPSAHLKLRSDNEAVTKQFSVGQVYELPLTPVK